VFVESGRFTEPIRPSAVVVNNTTIINQTKVINNMRQDTRTLAGSAPQKVFVNEGPGVDVVQRATGKRLAAKPVRELVRNAPVPSQQSTLAPGAKSQPPAAAATENPGSSRSREVNRHDNRVHGFPAPHQEGPGPEKPKEKQMNPPSTARPGKPQSPPAKPPKPPKEPKEGKGNGSEGDHPNGNKQESESNKSDQF
jgi:hypothetical protein